MSEVPTDGSTTAPATGPDDDFRRVHPLSPLLRGGLIAIGGLGYLISQQFDRIAGAFSPDAPGEWDDAARSGDDAFLDFLLQGPGLLLIAMLSFFVLIVAGAEMSWWFTRFRLGPSSLELRTGWLFRQHRQVAYDRIQAVDIVRPLLARLTGLSQVSVESAAGGDGKVDIAFLPHGEALSVQERLLGLVEAAGGDPGLAANAEIAGAGAAGAADAGAGPYAGSVAERAARRKARTTVIRTPFQRLLASVVLSAPALVGAVVVLVGIPVALVVGVGRFGVTGAAVVGFIPIVMLTAGRAVFRLTRWSNFTLSVGGGTLGAQRGLTDTRSTTVQIARVQAIEVSQPLLWRRAGWWEIKVNVAGASFGASTGDDDDDVLVPVATTAEMMATLRVIAGEDTTPAEVAGLVRDTPPDFVGQPRRARWFDPLAHRWIGYRLGERALLLRSGWVERRVQVVPYGRIQSQQILQGPLDRRTGLASVTFASTAGPVAPQVRHLGTREAEAAQAIVAAEAARARSAQRVDHHRAAGSR